MFISRLKDEQGEETELAKNTRWAYGMFKAEHIGEETTREDFINWCQEKIENGPFVLDKKPNKSSLKRWYHRWSHEESALQYILHIIEDTLSKSDDKYKINILELIIDDIKFIQKLYDERKKVFEISFESPKERYLILNHIENAISTIEKRIRVRLGLPTSYNNTKQEIQGDMNINKPGEENINNLSDEDLNLILSANDDENEEFLDKI